jgi:hypothetical protein
MRWIANKPLWYMVFAMLLLYATTADFVATTVVIADGQDCNHPWVRIEHKCDTASARTHSNDDHAASSATTSFLPGATLFDLSEAFMYVHGAHAAIYDLSDRPHNSVALRC